MSKHVATTPQLRMAIRSMRTVVRLMKSDPTYATLRVEKHMLDKAQLELADLRHLYYQRSDKDQMFILTDVKA